MKKILTAIILLPQLCLAQDSMRADLMRSDGKIYVVIVVAAIVISIAGIYMIMLDRRIRNLEKRVNRSNTTI